MWVNIVIDLVNPNPGRGREEEGEKKKKTGPMRPTGHPAPDLLLVY